jgi:hypothetical protein
MMRGIEMKKAFKASRLIGLLALALGLMAFSATAAQAEPGAFWEVNGSVLSGSAEVQAKNDTAHSTLLSTSGGSSVEILCGPIKFVGGTLSGTGGSGKIHYEECTTKLAGVTANRCVPRSPGAAAGLIETRQITALLKLHELAGGTKDDLLDLSPEGGVFVELSLGSGLCAIGNSIPITGLVTLKDCRGEALANVVEHLFEEGPLSTLKFGENPATIDGSAWGFLVGAHEHQTFSGHPA